MNAEKITVRMAEDGMFEAFYNSETWQGYIATGYSEAEARTLAEERAINDEACACGERRCGVKTGKTKMGYRVEVRVSQGILRTSQGFKVWEVLESDVCSGISRCMSKEKAMASYEKLVKSAFSYPEKLVRKKGGIL